MNLAQTLFDDYNVYRMQTRHVHGLIDKGIPMGLLQATPQRLSLFEGTVGWCRSHDAEPRLWVFSLFKSRQWMFSPKLTVGSLMSENHLPKYAKMRGLGFFRRRMSASRETAAFDPNRDTSGEIEAIKDRYQRSGQARRCLDETMTRTLGYHPKSRVCVACSEQSDCAVKLQSIMRFDVLALRDGRLDATRAEEIANG